VLLPDKPKVFCIINWQTPSLLYYHLINTKPSVLLPEKPQAFCIITRETLSLLYYHLTNPKPSVLSPDKPKDFCIITRLRISQVIIQKAWSFYGDNSECLAAIIGHVRPHVIRNMTDANNVIRHVNPYDIKTIELVSLMSYYMIHTVLIPSVLVYHMSLMTPDTLF
jgi:hypothetical protein